RLRGAGARHLATPAGAAPAVEVEDGEGAERLLDVVGGHVVVPAVADAAAPRVLEDEVAAPARVHGRQRRLRELLVAEEADEQHDVAGARLVGVLRVAVARVVADDAAGDARLLEP